MAFAQVQETHDLYLAILDVAPQAAIQVLREAHPDFDHDGDEPPPSYHDSTPVDLVQLLVTSAQALLQALRRKRNAQALMGACATARARSERSGTAITSPRATGAMRSSESFFALLAFLEDDEKLGHDEFVLGAAHI